MHAATSPLKQLNPAWYTVVMGLTGLSLAWHAATPAWGTGAAVLARLIGTVAALVFVVLVLAGAWRWHRHPEAWAADLTHPVRHVFMAALPVALLLLVTAATTMGLSGRLLDALWWMASLSELSATIWVMSRWWRQGPSSSLNPAALTPALFIPIVGNVLVPLAGVPLGWPEWSAAQFAIGLLLWPVVLVLLILRLQQQGLWPEPMLPASFIFVAPPAAIGLSAQRLGAAPLVVWGAWGVALFALLWVLPLMRRIAALPFGMAHWGMSFPMAACTALTLRVAPSGPLSWMGFGLLTVTTLLITALALATLRGVCNGSLLTPEAAAPVRVANAAV